MRSAVLDLGSNTFHLLIADVDEYGVRGVILDRKIATRLGEHAFDDRRIGAAAFARGLAAIEELAAEATAHAATCRIVATSVFRDATNGTRFLAEASRRSGLQIDLLDGHEEARLTWLGVSTELAGSHGRLAVLDLGGGSLECAVGTSAVEESHTFPLGVLRLRGQDAGAVRAAVLAEVAGPFRTLGCTSLDTLALASGSARTLLRLARRLGFLAEGQRHMWQATLGELARALAPLPAPALRDLGVDAARVDTIATGAAVLHAAVEVLRRPVVYVARGALREGVLVDGAARDRSRAAVSALQVVS